MTAPAIGSAFEISRVFTPLGIRFWDAALDLPVSEGLRVTAIHVSGEYPATVARRSQSGVYAFHDLPLLRSVEFPVGEVDVSTHVPAHDFAVTVEDQLGRFLPCLFVVRLPLGYRGLFLSDPVLSPPGPAGRALLFSAPIRPIPAGQAAVRADIWDRTADAPAAHAALRVTIEGRTYTTVADASGRALAIFPYPTLEQLRLGSPPGSGQGRVTESRWTISLRVGHPPTERPPLADAADAAGPWRTVPSLKPILRAADAPVWSSEAGPSANSITRELRYGDPLVATTTGSAAVRARLWIN